MQADRKRRVRIAPNLYQRPSDGKFEIGFSDTGGRWRIKTLRARTRTEAKAEGDLFMTKLRAGEVAAPSKVTFAEVSAEYIAGPSRRWLRPANVLLALSSATSSTSTLTSFLESATSKCRS